MLACGSKSYDPQSSQQCCDLSTGKSVQGAHSGQGFQMFDTADSLCTRICGVIPNNQQCCSKGEVGSACCGAKAYDSTQFQCTDKCGIISNTLQCCNNGHSGGACCGGEPINTSTTGCCPSQDHDGLWEGNTQFDNQTSLCCTDAQGGKGQIYQNYGYDCCHDYVCQINPPATTCCP